MASLLSGTLLKSGPKLGTASASSLIKSAGTLQGQITAFQDTEAKLTYENSAKTPADLQAYTEYLGNRIDNLQATGSVPNATKALSMSQDVISATHANISADIQRENINLMANGEANTPNGYKSKMDTVSSEYTRALAIGDNGLAQSLMSQYYSLSQSYQQSVQAAADAQTALIKAKADYEGSVATNLGDFLKSFQGTAKNLTQSELNDAVAANIKDLAPQLKALGVVLPEGAQPNYWDLVHGVSGAIYNATILEAQAKTGEGTPTADLQAKDLAMKAQNYLTGAEKIPTLAGDLTVQEISQAQQDPQMFSYDNSTGTYKKTVQNGYQYMTFTNADGSTATQLVPRYSGYESTAKANQVAFLSPAQTVQMSRLGLEFSQNVNGKSVENTPDGPSGTTGNGVKVQLTDQSPNWLKNLLGKGDISNIYLGPSIGGNFKGDGFLQFEGKSSTGSGKSMYTIATDDKGLHGLYENLPNGSYQLTGGDYGFNQGAVNLLMNQAQQQMQITSVQTAQAQAALQTKIADAQTQALTVAPPAPLTAPSTQIDNVVQPTANPQITFNPQAGNVSPQPATVNPQQTVNGPSLNQSGPSTGIKLTVPQVSGIRLR